MSRGLARVRPRVRARGIILAGIALAGIAAALFAPAPASAQQPDSVVWVWLDDAAFVEAAQPALGARALARRARHGIPAFANDAPIPDAVVSALEAAGLDVRFRSRWLRAVSGSATREELERIRALVVVSRITPVGSIGAPQPQPQPQPLPAAARDAAPPPEFYGEAYDQVAQIGVPLAHELGFTGAGVVVAMFDTGFDPAVRSLDGLDVIGAHDFINGDSIVAQQPGDPFTQHHHGTETWSVLGGHDPDFFVGPAYGAQFLLAKIDRVDAEPRADEDRWVAALEWADSMGAQLVSSSLSYFDFDGGFTWSDADLDGNTTPTTIAADAAAARGILIVNSASNDGRGRLGAPADADSIIAVGAVNQDGFLASFSSTGPTADGRIKPELVARGVSTIAAVPVGGDPYGSFSGTSFSAPLVAGGAALVMEAWPELDAMAVRQALLLSGSNHTPNDSMGHGLPDVASAITFPMGIVPQPTGASGPNGVLRSLSPTFAWQVPLLHPSAGSVRYRLQIASDSAFDTIVHEDTVVDASSVTLSDPLAAGEGLWWRVVGETEIGVVHASAAVGPFTMEPWVRLATLNDVESEFIEDRTPLLVWDPLPAAPPIGPLEFDIEIISAITGEIFLLIAGMPDTSAVVVEPLPFNVPFRWRVIVQTAMGAVDTAESVAPFVVVSADAPPVTLLYQNFPNPFPRIGVPSTTIWFDLAEASTASLSVYDIRGRLVRRMVPDARQGCTAQMRLEAGSYGRTADPPCVATSWDGTTDDGERLPPGIYLIRLMTERGSHTVRTLYRP